MVAAEVGQLRTVRTIRESLGHLTDDSLGQPRFTHTADPNQRDQSASLQQVTAGGQLRLTAHETGGFHMTEVRRDDADSIPLRLRPVQVAPYLLPARVPQVWIPTAGADVATEYLSSGQPLPSGGLRQGTGGEMGRIGHL
ncbi:hypothetical protein ADL12_06855 [Streptomyces regalis]|uniref:Uncharacterized protein n=1 Tax=Streptomyces regalis TaxID=68262 RepID=A0A0X3VG66_9ACTN|nr:hypothetical protein ADL12_06855 [Streptomyces regalis]